MNTNIENEVCKIVFKRKYMSIVELSEVLNVSQSTIRRVLNRLQSKKLVERSHGGVRAVLTDNVAPNFVLRKHTNATQKKMIALKALKLIKEGDVIFLDGSTSTYFMAEYLNEFDNATVITNGIDTLVALAGCGVNAISTGGCVSRARGISDAVSKYGDMDSYSNTFVEVVGDDSLLVVYNDMKYDTGDGKNHKATMVADIKLCI